MTRDPQRLLLDRVPSPLGTLWLVWDRDDVLRALDFADHEARLQRLLRRHYGPRTLEPGRAPAGITDPLAAFFAGDLGAIDGVTVGTNGTEFQRRVWSALRRIPAARSWSYGALAAYLERPNASRAVGLANGANPIAIVVPCHRVIGADGTLIGYGGGLERKRWLLAHEERWSNAERRVSA